MNNGTPKPQYNSQIHHRRTIRLNSYDYSQVGAYFITICTIHRECIFGEIVNGEMILNDFGQIAHDEWLKTTRIRPNITLDVFVIMPNHIHGIIIISRDDLSSGGECDSPLQDGDITRRGELHSPKDDVISDSTNNDDVISRDDLSYGGERDSPLQDGDITRRGELHSPKDDVILPPSYKTSFVSPSNNIPAIIRGYKSAVTKRLNLLNFGGSAWHRNYYEHIISSEKSSQNIADYIINNPVLWDTDKYYIK